MRSYENLFLTTFAAGPSFGHRHAKVACPDIIALSGTAIHHSGLVVIDGLGERHDVSPMMLNNERLAVLHLPDNYIGAVAAPVPHAGICAPTRA